MKLRTVTATRGGSPYWPESARSVVAARAGTEHVIVCPAAWTAAARSQDTSLTVVVEKALGLYPNLNQGLREPPGDWNAFTWINDDDVLRSPGFGALVAELEQDHNVDIAYGRVAAIDGRGARLCELPVARRTSDLAALFAGGIIPLAQPGTVIRRWVWEQLGGFDETFRFAGDMDFFARAVAMGARFRFVDAEVAAFRLSAGQLSKHREEVERETKRALRPLESCTHRTLALMRFRLANFRVYIERMRRQGWVSMRDLYDRTE